MVGRGGIYNGLHGDGRPVGSPSSVQRQARIAPITVTTQAEFYLGGLRFDPGTYEIRRVEKPAEPQF